MTIDQLIAELQRLKVEGVSGEIPLVTCSYPNGKYEGSVYKALSVTLGSIEDKEENIVEVMICN